MTLGISPRRLLVQADRLVGTGRGRPSPTDLRRAASSAYYALFHRITRLIAWKALPGRPEEEWLLLTRSISHTAIRDVSNLVVSAGGPDHLRPLIADAGQDQDLVRLADTFVQAQELRHRADYDHLAVLAKADVVAQIQAVRRVSDSIDDLAERSSFDAFRAAVLLKSTAK